MMLQFWGMSRLIVMSGLKPMLLKVQTCHHSKGERDWPPVSQSAALHKHKQGQTKQGSESQSLNSNVFLSTVGPLSPSLPASFSLGLFPVLPPFP